MGLNTGTEGQPCTTPPRAGSAPGHRASPRAVNLASRSYGYRPAECRPEDRWAVGRRVSNHRMSPAQTAMRAVASSPEQDFLAFVGSAIRRLRGEQGLSRRELAQRAD